MDYNQKWGQRMKKMNKEQLEKKIEEFFACAIYDKEKYDYQNLYNLLKKNLNSLSDFEKYFKSINREDLENDLLDENIIVEFLSFWIFFKKDNKVILQFLQYYP